MGYYVSNMIGIRTGGVFAGDVDLPALQERIMELCEAMSKEDEPFDGPIDTGCISHELQDRKGSYVVIAGVFNGWFWERTSEFSRRLSAKLQTEVMHMCWNEETGAINCEVFLAGKPLSEINEDPIAQIVRRVT